MLYLRTKSVRQFAFLELVASNPQPLGGLVFIVWNQIWTKAFWMNERIGYWMGFMDVDIAQSRLGQVLEFSVNRMFFLGHCYLHVCLRGYFQANTAVCRCILLLTWHHMNVGPDAHKESERTVLQP